MAANRQLGTSFTSIVNMILYRADKQHNINNSKSEEKDEIYLPRLARDYIKILPSFQDDNKIPTTNAKWFMWKMLEKAIAIHNTSRMASIHLPKMCMFLQTWEEESFPGMINIDEKDTIHEKYRTILEKVGLLEPFTFKNKLQLGNTPIITIIQNLKNTGGNRNMRKRSIKRSKRKQRKTRKN
jgi:hypothetical protein